MNLHLPNLRCVYGMGDFVNNAEYVKLAVPGTARSVVTSVQAESHGNIEFPKPSVPSDLEGGTSRIRADNCGSGTCHRRGFQCTQR